LSIQVLLIFKTSQGRNWARMTLLLLVMLAAPMAFSAVQEGFGKSPLEGLYVAAPAVIRFVAIGLLFSSPARDEFSRD
jgi:ABC-type transport system involved in multi-copper enzyme maturation permease subunit